MARLAKLVPVDLNNPPFTRSEVIKKILDCKDFSPEVENSTELHLPLIGVHAGGARFQRTYTFLSNHNKKEKSVLKSKYEVTVDLPYALLGEKLTTHIFLRPYVEEWDELITINFQGNLTSYKS